MKDKKNQQDKTKEEIKYAVDQPTCCSCGSKKLQLFLISATEKESRLDIICIECGLWQVLDLGGMNLKTKQAETKSIPNYLG